MVGTGAAAPPAPFGELGEICICCCPFFFSADDVFISNRASTTSPSPSVAFFCAGVVIAPMAADKSGREALSGEAVAVLRPPAAISLDAATTAAATAEADGRSR